MQFHLILLYTILVRTLFISDFPPVSNSTILPLRYLSVAMVTITVILLYIIVHHKNRNKKIALLSSWVFTNLFWTIEQGRIAPQLQYWMFQLSQLPHLSIDSLKNFFTIVSPEYIFFKNTYFWWGGVRDFGIVNLSFSPFFLFGMYEAISEGKWKLLTGLFILVVITALNPSFPEAREFYLVTPFFAYIIAVGIYRSSLRVTVKRTIIGIFIFLFFIYEQMQYFHYYTTHYYQDVKNNLYQIREAF